MTDPEDFTDYDATNVLALALYRWESRSQYRLPGGWSGDLRTLVYSNGTEHGFASENAETVLELAPALRVVLQAGIRALSNDPKFEAYLAASAAGDADEIVAIERSLTETAS